MQLTDIFQALESGELSTQTSLVDTVTGVKAENYTKVISHVNLGLANLHERFNLKIGDLWIMMTDGIGEYKLDYKHAMTNVNSNEPKYIMDSPYDIFGDEVLKIIEATTEIGEPLPINDRTQDKSIFTPSQNSIQIPWKVDGDVINIMYRASHKVIRLEDYDKVEDIEVDLPLNYLEALLYFIAFRHFAGVGGKSATPTSQAYYQKYLARVKEIELNGIPNQDLSESTDFQRNNWA